MEWTRGLEDFLERFDAYAQEYLTPWHAQGCADLPEQNLALGPRYSLKGHDAPLSIFRGEGVILWALARQFKARTIAETYTGTGVAAAFLSAAGAGTVWTCDNYSEGGLGQIGWDHAHHIASVLQAPFRAHWGGVEQFGATARYDMHFADGTLPLVPARVTCIHNRIDYASPFAFRIVGTSHLVVRCENQPDFQAAQNAVVDALCWLTERHEVNASA